MPRSSMPVYASVCYISSWLFYKVPLDVVIYHSNHVTPALLFDSLHNCSKLPPGFFFFQVHATVVIADSLSLSLVESSRLFVLSLKLYDVSTPSSHWPDHLYLCGCCAMLFLRSMVVNCTTHVCQASTRWTNMYWYKQIYHKQNK